MATFSLSFGGFGDFATVVQILTATCTLLVECYNADKHTQEVLAFLADFNNSTLALLDPFSGPPSDAPGDRGARPVLAGPCAVIRASLEVCRREIQAFYAKLVPSDTLERRADGMWIQVRRAVRWTWALRQDAKTLRGTLERQSSCIHLALSVLNAHMTRFLVVRAVSHNISATNSMGPPSVLAGISRDRCPSPNILRKLIRNHFRSRAPETSGRRGSSVLALQHTGSAFNAAATASKWHDAPNGTGTVQISSFVTFTAPSTDTAKASSRGLRLMSKSTIANPVTDAAASAEAGRAMTAQTIERMLALMRSVEETVRLADTVVICGSCNGRLRLKPAEGPGAELPPDDVYCEYCGVSRSLQRYQRPREGPLAMGRGGSSVGFESESHAVYEELAFMHKLCYPRLAPGEASAFGAAFASVRTKMLKVICAEPAVPGELRTQLSELLSGAGAASGRIEDI